MKTSNFPLLSSLDLNELEHAIYYMNMEELRNSCHQLCLPDKGKKAALINRILTFLKTGEIINSLPIPKISRGQENPPKTLTQDTLILYGHYKNDANTRSFMKTLVGNHFHFTAFGVDWIHERWILGKPPTFKEFAAFWEEEYEARKNKKATPKREWAYLNFIQNYLLKDPNASRQEIIKEWEKVRLSQAQKAQNILGKLTNT